MLQDLDSTLKELLERELPSDLLPSLTDNISFDSPVQTNKPNGINLFLYDIRENMDLRSGLAEYERQGISTAIKKRPAVRVNCSYLITAWSASDRAVQDEHKILGNVMKVLLRYRKLPKEVLQGSLKGQEPPIRSTLLGPNLLQSFGEFWQAMGGKPKAALNYTITISVPVDEVGEEFPLVTDSQIYLRSNS
jgi:hypothetical protein